MPGLLRMRTMCAVLVAAGCGTMSRQESRNVTASSKVAAHEADAHENPLLAPWSGGYGGVPPFGSVEVAHFKPALEAAMKAQRAEIERLVGETAPPTFENTILALEDSGRLLTRVHAVYGVWSTSLRSAAFQELEREVEPVLAAFQDEIMQDPRLFRRVAAVYESARAQLPKEAQRLVWRHYTDLVLAGAQLGDAEKRELTAVNQELAVLFTDFAQNVLSDEESYALVLASEDELAGLPESVRAGEAATAEAHGLAGKWAIANTRSAVEPFLTLSPRRDLREQLFHTFVSRGDHGDEHDNKEIVRRILALRAKRAKLLGYPTHAHYRLTDTMAKTPEAALSLMTAVWKPALARVDEELRAMRPFAEREAKRSAIEPWDVRYYAEKVRKQKYDLDQNDLKPYLQLEKLREGLFYVAGELFGLAFRQVDDVPVFHPDVRVWEVTAREGGRHVGLWYFDPYARPGKQSGAWMSAYREQERFRGEVSTIVSNNANFMKPQPGKPTLVSWDDAVTLFHEFGHALHGLCSNVSYPSLSGTEVARDYVEFPSQLLEHWLPTPEVLSRFALHYETGEPMPPALVERIRRAATFNEGFRTVEYLSTALIDMKLHLAGDADIDPGAFERDTLAALGMPRAIVMRHRTPQLTHVFAGDDYSAGYYSYLWADAITADAFEAFIEHGGPWSADMAARLREHVFSVGGTIDAAESYRAFRGRDPGVDALMRKRGFAKKRAH